MNQTPFLIAYEAAAFTLTAPGVKLRGVQPAALILSSAEETPVQVLANGTPTCYQAQRLTPLGMLREETWRWDDPRGFELSWTLGVFADLPGLTVQASLTNRSATPLRLREFVLAQSDAAGLHYDGDPAAWWLGTLEHSMRAASLAERLPSLNDAERTMWQGFGLPIPYQLPNDERHNDGRWRSFNDFLTLYRADGQQGMTFGAVGAPVADLRFDCFVAANTLSLSIICEMNDVLLLPGASRSSQQLCLLACPYPVAVERIMRWIAATHGQRTHRGPLVGWCSWYDRGPDISAAHMTAVVEAFAAQRAELPVNVIQIDDGYQVQAGDWRCNERFPEGMRALVEQIEGVGARAGIWLAPLAVHDSLGLLDAHPDWFQRSADGALAGEANNWGPTAHWLDPTHPEVQQRLRALMRAKRREGFGYFKIDFNTLGRDVRWHDPCVTRLEALRNLYRLYREEIGEEAYLLACMPFGRGAMGYADASRIGPDSVAIWEALHPCTILECIRALGSSSHANGIAFAHDPDVSYLRPRGTKTSPTGDDAGTTAPLTLAEWRTWHSFVGLLGGLMLISDPIHEPAYAEHSRALALLCPPAAERGRAWPAVTSRDHQQFGFLALRPSGDFATMLLWNPQPEPASVALDTSGLEALGERFHVWSFWDERYLGLHDADFTTAPLAPHGPALLRLTALPAHDGLPVLLGSTLHISCGAAEVIEVAATSTGLTIRLSDAGARQGTLYIYSRATLCPGAAEGLVVDTVTACAADCWAIGVSARRRGEPQSLFLKVKTP